MVLPTGTWQRGDNHREPRSVPRQISCVGVLGANGIRDHSRSRCLHRQDYDSLLGKRNMENTNTINERLLFTQFYLDVLFLLHIGFIYLPVHLP